MDDQQELFHERFSDALKAMAEGAGGLKRVGHRLRPELSPEDAGIWLRNVFDSERREKASVEQIDLLLAIGREAGIHLAMYYLCDAHGYERPRPLDAEEQKDEARRELSRRLRAVEEFMPMAKRLLEDR